MVAPEPGESLYSWMGAIAAEYGISLQHAYRITGAVPADDPRRMDPKLQRSPLFELAGDESARIGAATGLSAEGIRDLTWARFSGTAVPSDAARGRMQMRPWIGYFGVIGERRRVCPGCLADNDGRWPLAWCLPWQYLCPTHQCYLLDRCPHCEHPFGLTPSRWGTCTGCLTRPEAMEAPAATDSELISLQRTLMTHFDATGDRRASARRDFADLWAMTHLAMFTAHPEHLEGADQPVYDAFEEFCRTSERHRLSQPAPNVRRTPPTLLSAGLIKIAARITFADEPFRAAHLVNGLGNAEKSKELTRLHHAWQAEPLKLAPWHTTERLEEIMTAVIGPSFADSRNRYRLTVQHSRTRATAQPAQAARFAAINLPGHTRRVALSVDPLPGESLVSWLHAVAADYGIDPHRAAQLTGLVWANGRASGVVVSDNAPVYGPHRSWLPRAVAATGLPPEQLTAMTWHRFRGTALPPVDGEHATVATTRKFVKAYWIEPYEMKLCPQCCREADGRWQLAWGLPWVYACPVHSCYLVERCPSCRHALTVSGTDPVAGRCRRERSMPQGKPTVCGFSWRDLEALPVHDEEILALQKLLLGHLDTDNDKDRRPARADFRDLWAAASLALYTAGPDHLEGADAAVVEAFTRFCDTYDSPWGRRMVSGARLRPGSLVTAAVLRLAARITFADDPLEAAESITRLRSQSDSPAIKSFRKQLRFGALSRAPGSATDRLAAVMRLALHGGPDVVPHTAGLPVEAASRARLLRPAPGRFSSGN
ncbi:TniQ family protein [Kitasatospora sp. NPDC058478]|uniref:TniQ family protein n=1 Tax=unclassified Kitasatospora TaxID=2633591 RepID=UPI0036499672